MNIYAVSFDRMDRYTMTKHNDNTQQRILDAACRLFAEDGFENVTTRTIADEAKAKLGSIYYHFESKEALYVEVFRRVYDVANALTYDVLLAKEPQVFSTPEGKAYAIQRVVFDYFQRHIFTPEEWRRKLISRELFSRSQMFSRMVEEVLKDETEKMIRFYYLLSPEGSEAEACYWAHLPDTQGLYYFMAAGIIPQYHDPQFQEEMRRTIITQTTKLMITLLDLPVPAMLN